MAKITACSTLVYTQSAVEEALKRISAHGFTRVEIASLASYCKHFDEESNKTDSFKKLLLKNKLTPIALNYSTNRSDGYRYRLNESKEAFIVRNKLVKVIGAAAKVGIPIVNTGPGQRNDTNGRRDEMVKAAALISSIAEYAKGLGIRLTLEVPHCWLLCSDLERTKEMFSLITSDNVGVIIDSSHWHVVGYDMDEYMKMLGDRLCHVHLRDAAGTDTKDFNQKLEITPGKGEVDFEKFGRYLDKYGYSGDVSIEFEYKGKSLDEIEDEFTMGMEYLEKCGWELPKGVK